MSENLEQSILRGYLELRWKNIALIAVFFTLVAIFIAWTRRPDEELLLQTLKDLDLPIVGKRPNVNVSEALEIGTTTVSICSSSRSRSYRNSAQFGH